MDSVRGFFRIWIAVALVLIVYSVVDLRLNPWLHHESYFSMRPDWSRLPDLMHWGGRLLRHGAVSLWITNALLTKPFTLKQLSDAIRAVLEGRELVQADP